MTPRRLVVVVVACVLFGWFVSLQLLDEGSKSAEISAAASPLGFAGDELARESESRATHGLSRIQQLSTPSDSAPLLRLPADNTAEAPSSALIGEREVASLTTGTAFDFFPPGRDEPLAARVDRMQQHANGDYSIDATLTEQFGSVVITVGEQMSFATVTLDGRVYNLQTEAGQTWLIEAQHLGSTDNNDFDMAPAPRQKPLELTRETLADIPAQR